MESEAKLLVGAMTMLAIATGALVVVPYVTVKKSPPAAGLKPYTAVELRGRQQYIAEGCVYCHSQQPRTRSFAPDVQRGWGRATTAGDYAYDAPHLLGTMRTGPDLMNIGARQPSEQWHLGHLYQPRAYVPGSVMPSYPYLFTVKAKAEPEDVVVNVPKPFSPPGKVIVAERRTVELVAYLKSLNRTYPILEAPAAASAPPATP